MYSMYILYFQNILSTFSSAPDPKCATFQTANIFICLSASFLSLLSPCDKKPDARLSHNDRTSKALIHSPH